MSTPPLWINEFANRVSNAILGDDVLPPLGCHYHFADNVCEITLFASRTEIVGGPRDGRQLGSRFFVDIPAVLAIFDAVASCHWYSGSTPSEVDQQEVAMCAYLSIEGEFDHHTVWLRVPAIAPEDFAPGRRVLIHDQSFEEMW